MSITLITQESHAGDPVSMLKLSVQGSKFCKYGSGSPIGVKDTGGLRDVYTPT